jgi:hypothetical protein
MKVETNCDFERSGPDYLHCKRCHRIVRTTQPPEKVSANCRLYKTGAAANRSCSRNRDVSP